MLTWMVFLIVICNPCKSLYISNNSFLSDSVLLSEQASTNSDSLELPVCKDDKFLGVLVHFRVANPEDLFLLAMRGSDDPNLCRDLTVGTDRITQYLKHCCPTSEQDLYIKLLSGLGIVKEKICDDSDFNNLIKMKEDCYNTVQYETEPCFGPNDWLEMKNSSEFCNTMKSVLGCYYTTTLVNCDLLAAEILNDLMTSIMNSVSDENCPNLVKGNYIRNLRSLSASSSLDLKAMKTLTIISYILLLAAREGIF